MLFLKVFLVVLLVFGNTFNQSVGILSKTFSKSDTKCSGDVGMYGYFSTDSCYTFDKKTYFKNFLNVENNTFFIYIFSDEKCQQLLKPVNDFLYQCFVDPVTYLPMTNELLSSIVAFEAMSVFSNENTTTAVIYSGDDCTGEVQWATSQIMTNCTSVDCNYGMKVICGEFVE